MDADALTWGSHEPLGDSHGAPVDLPWVQMVVHGSPMGSHGSSVGSCGDTMGVHGSAMGLSWAPVGVHKSAMGAHHVGVHGRPWAAHGSPVGQLWAPVGLMWVHIGVRWSPMGLLWVPTGLSWAPMGPCVSHDHAQLSHESPMGVYGRLWTAYWSPMGLPPVGTMFNPLEGCSFTGFPGVSHCFAPSRERQTSLSTGSNRCKCLHRIPTCLPTAEGGFVNLL